jgi:SAM-dependent methyltransferase
MVPDEDVEERERDFWDHHVPSLDECLDLYHQGPDELSAQLLDALDVQPGQTVLDFACGAGLTSAWLAASGAKVVGVDVSPISVERAGALRDALGLDIDLRVVGLGVPPTNDGEQFDRVAGRFALHHLDLDVYAPLIAAAVGPGGRAAFLETMATNPLLRFARSNVVGRFGVPRMGTLDEHPLTNDDMRLLERFFGPIDVRVQQLDFFKLVDRQVLRGRRPKVGRALRRADELLHRSPRLHFLSYHQVLVFDRR